MFNKFFENPDDDIRDIYNDSSGTNNSNSLNAASLKQMKNQRAGLSKRSDFADDRSVEDHFRNFSFYDSPQEENEILASIKRCCARIGQMPQAPSYQAQVDHNLNKISSHMSKWIQNNKRLICEEQPEEDESSTGRNYKDGEISIDNDSISLEQNDIIISNVPSKAQLNIQNTMSQNKLKFNVQTNR